ncbi:MAG: alpha/beta fold hydrolase [Desulfobulbaceae bacterium]|nr:MAG: alpha/beta fold hydrolase [Desulfobulbaceae bacterium]
MRSSSNYSFYQYPFEPKSLDIAGYQLRYLDEGEGDPVILLHGNPTWSYYYRNLAQTLSPQHRVIVPDHLGCGLSDKPQNYNYCLENHISNIELLIDHLEISKFSLVVHDWGGAIGFGVAGRHIQKVLKIAVLNTAAFRSTRIPLRIRICKVPFLGELIVRGFNGFAYPATFMAVSEKMDQRVAEAYLKPYSSWADRVAIYKFVRDIPLNESHQSYETLREVENNLELIRDANIPLALYWGGKDFCFNDHFFEEWKLRFPNATAHYYPEAGHYILEDVGNVVEAEILSFIS